jgi:hypothetical protein
MDTIAVDMSVDIIKPNIKNIRKLMYKTGILTTNLYEESRLIISSVLYLKTTYPNLSGWWTVFYT